MLDLIGSARILDLWTSPPDRITRQRDVPNMCNRIRFRTPKRTRTWTIFWQRSVRVVICRDQNVTNLILYLLRLGSLEFVQVLLNSMT